MNSLATLTFGHAAGKDVTHAIPDGTGAATDSTGAVVHPDVSVVALCGTRLRPDVVEDGVDRRAEKVSGVRVCGTCSRLIVEGKTEFPDHARGEKPPVAEPALDEKLAASAKKTTAKSTAAKKTTAKKTTAAKKSSGSANGAKPLSDSEIRKALKRMDELHPKWKAYQDDRRAKKQTKRFPKEHREWEQLYAAIRRSNMTLAEARKKVEKTAA